MFIYTLLCLIRVLLFNAEACFLFVYRWLCVRCSKFRVSNDISSFNPLLSIYEESQVFLITPGIVLHKWEFFAI